MRSRSIPTILMALAVAASALYLWRRSPSGTLVEREAVLPPAEATPSSPPSPIAPPQLAEVPLLLDRVFQQTLMLDRRAGPAFLAGDFNGDGVTDLAVAARPRGAEILPTLNDRLAAWSLQDATAPPPDAVSKPAPVQVGAEDPLLAVVHGVGPDGWRSPEARQGYLVKNAVGSQMRPRPLAGVPDRIRMQLTRYHAGDVIAETRGRRPGLILWTGAAYVWADLESPTD